MTTLVNVLTVDPANQTRLLDLLRANVDTVIRTLDGWIATNLIASADGTRVVIHSQWRNARPRAPQTVRSVLIARRSSIARYPSATCASGSVWSNTFPGSISPFQIKSMSSGRYRRTGAGPPRR